MFFPIGKSVARWDQRTPTLGELLMPVTRSAYLRQLGGAAALNELQLWAAMSTVAVACVLVTGNDGPPLATILDLLVISGLSQIWLFGVAVWWTRCQSCLLGLLVGLVAIFEPIVLIGMLWGGLPAEWRYATWFVAGLFALFGLLLMRNAYRRWWWTELDCVRT